MVGGGWRAHGFAHYCQGSGYAAGDMREHRFTVLEFGHVMIESTFRGCVVRVYSEDYKWCWEKRNPSYVIPYPLDELAKRVKGDAVERIAEAIFSDVESALEESYVGGVERARADFVRWLLDNGAGDMHNAPR